MKIGDRVISIDGSIGIVEAVDDNPEYPLADVRYLTPKNEPSCCIGTCSQRDLKIIPDHVIPMPRSKEWWAKAREFHAMIKAALEKISSNDKF